CLLARGLGESAGISIDSPDGQRNRADLLRPRQQDWVVKHHRAFLGTLGLDQVARSPQPARRATYVQGPKPFVYCNTLGPQRSEENGTAQAKARRVELNT